MPYEEKKYYYDRRRIVRNSEATGRALFSILAPVAIYAISGPILRDFGIEGIEQKVSQLATTSLLSAATFIPAMKLGEFTGFVTGRTIYKARKKNKEYKVIHIVPTKDHPSRHNHQ